MSTSEDFMDVEALPERVVFMGGGYISFEFAHMVAAAGSQAVILHRGAQVLRGFDPDLAEMLASGYRSLGIEVRTNAPVTSVAQLDGRLSVGLADGSAVPCDMVVHGAGRVPDLEALDLPAAQVSFGPRGIEVDRSMRSVSNPRVFAVGDAAALGPPLTPVGIAQARIAARNVVEPGSAVFDPPVIPSIVFSDPPMASVGLTEKAAADKDIDVEVKLTDMTEWVASRRVGAQVAGAKTLVDRATGRVVGVHLLGHGADEVINVVTAAILGGLSREDMKAAIWGYPTTGSDLVYLF